MRIQQLDESRHASTSSAEAAKPRTRMLPPAPYAVALLGGWWLDRHARALGFDLGPVAVPLGWIFVVLGLALFGWTLATFRRHGTTVNPYRGATTLCTEGPFGFSRNPIYLGDWILLIGISLLLRTAWPLLFAPAIWAILRFGVIRHEERHLQARFGPAYEAYRRRVRRWL
jgi:protein-S-isoprenylcysteine O-methyltransferase Ste14